jgi:hypothetical protein
MSKTKMKFWLRTICLLLLSLTCAGTVAQAQSTAQPEAGAAPQAKKDSSESRPPSLSLSPAVVLARGAFGQSLSQTLSITNDTTNEFAFEMAAQDVVVKDGKRIFVPAGESQRSIAATAVFSQKTVIVKPFTSASVDVRFTIPAETEIRAVIALFRGTNRIASSSGAIGMTASLGTLITFNLTPNVNVKPEPIQVIPATDAANLSVSEWMTNNGTEPILPEGVAAVLNSRGALVGKTTFPVQRLLPGERLEFKAEYPEQLEPGSYKVLCSFQFEGKTLTTDGSFTVR